MNLKRIEEILRSKLINGEIRSETDEIWANIEHQLPKKERSNKFLLWMIFPFLVGIFLYGYQYHQDQARRNDKEVTEENHRSTDPLLSTSLAFSDEIMVNSEVKTIERRSMNNDGSILDSPSSVLDQLSEVKPNGSNSSNEKEKVVHKRSSSKEVKDRDEKNDFRALDQEKEADSESIKKIEHQKRGLSKIPVLDIFKVEEEYSIRNMETSKVTDKRLHSRLMQRRESFIAVHYGLSRNLGTLKGESMESMDAIDPLETQVLGISMGKTQGNFRWSVGLERRASYWSVKEVITNYQEQQISSLSAVMLQALDGEIYQLEGSLTETSETIRNYDVHTQLISWSFPVILDYLSGRGRWRYMAGVGMNFSVRNELKTYAKAPLSVDNDLEKYTLVDRSPRAVALVNLRMEYLLSPTLGASISASYQKSLSNINWEDPVEIDLKNEQLGLVASVSKYW